MIEAVCSRILLLCDIVPDAVKEIPPDEFNRTRAENRWSKKEMLGHLIDSVAINHQRFVRAQAEINPEINYQQDEWVKLQNYASADTHILLSLWQAYNRHLVHVIKNIPVEDLNKSCRSEDGKLSSISFLIADYLRHLEHHLHQILELSNTEQLVKE